MKRTVIAKKGLIFFILIIILAVSLISCGEEWVSIKLSDLRNARSQLEDAQSTLSILSNEYPNSPIDEALRRVEIALYIIDDAIRTHEEIKHEPVDEY